MSTYLYSRVSATPCGIALRLPGNEPPDASYYRWSDGTWTSPFKPADHVLQCVRDAGQPTLWVARVPVGQLYPNALLLEYLTGGGSTTLDSVQAAGVPLLWPGRGSLSMA